MLRSLLRPRARRTLAELFDSVLATIEGDHCVDMKRVFVAGFSWGGDPLHARDGRRQRLRGSLGHARPAGRGNDTWAFFDSLH